VIAIVLIHYKVPLDVVAQHTADHRAYLGALNAQGKVLASGPFVPRTGGALLLRVAHEAEAQAIVDGDPFKLRGVADHEVRVWAPTLGADKLEAM
jgi:uncharacterized protein YciI